MLVITARNVNDAFHQGLVLLNARGLRQSSRAGSVLAMDYPVTTQYLKPIERVLYDPMRDANPFFHLMESVWMLAGRRDATWLDRYVKDFSSRFAEKNGDAHGAYGHRWRGHFEMEGGGGNDFIPDQLWSVGRMLYMDPTTRRAVLTMWDPIADLGADKRDLPCNTQVFFRTSRDHMDEIWNLDITVVNRSNDIIWGAYGANAVHMSIMGEVVAGLAGMRFRHYHQVSNNYHAYEDIFKKQWPFKQTNDPYVSGAVKPFRIIPESGNRARMREQAIDVLEDAEKFCAGQLGLLASDWFNRVVAPMQFAHEHWRAGDIDGALQRIRSVEASDWRMAGGLWLTRRKQRRESTQIRDK